MTLSHNSPWQKSRGRCLGLFLGTFVVETPRILLQYSSFLRLGAEENPRRIAARDFCHGLLSVRAMESGLIRNPFQCKSVMTPCCVPLCRVTRFIH